MCEVVHGCVAKWRLEGLPRYAVAQCLTFFRRPVLHKVPCRIEGRLIIVDANPQRRHAADAPPLTTIGTAHFEKFLEPDFRENGGQMICPVAHHRRDVFYVWNFALQKVAETTAGNVDVPSVAVDEIHRNVERVIYIAFERHT